MLSDEKSSNYWFKSLGGKSEGNPATPHWGLREICICEDYVIFDYLPRNDFIRYFQGKRFASRGACSCRRRSSCHSTPATSR